MINITLRFLALALIIGRFIYWEVEKFETDKKLPKTKRKRSFIEVGSLYFASFLFLLVCVQLLGMNIIPIYPRNIFLQLAGLVVLSVGTWICIIARQEIAENWVSGEEYQVKKNQKLVTSGIYSWIRHPIYVGLAVSFIGAEMVAQSYLSISFLAYFVVAYIQGKREERILLAHFGDEYKKYMKHTKMLIPFVL